LVRFAEHTTGLVKRIGLVAGPVLAALVFLALPQQYIDEMGAVVDLSRQARAVAAFGTWMAVWWMTEAIPLYATALIPLAAFPLAGATTIKQAAAPYGHELIYLFLGGFIIALALERWGLHRRMALTALRAVGTSPWLIIGAFMGIASALSMWVTNTATTIMLLPVAVSVIDLLPARSTDEGDEPGPAADTGQNFPVCLLLGIAYAASIGGIGTIVGTAPNLFVVSFLQNQLGIEISFARWMLIGVPLVLVFVPCVWLLLTRVIYPVSNRANPGAFQLLKAESLQMPAMQRGEKLTLMVFAATALAWVFRPLLNQLQVAGVRPLEGLTDPGIAVLGALLLFVLPADSEHRRFVMDWETAVKLPWGLLILFGGGLSLAAALDASGFSAFLGSRAVALAPLPTWAIVVLVTGLMIFLTELTSNTATTATLVPILYAVATGLGLDPLILILPAGIAASCAFMLPVATPPNAIVFGSGMISVPQMCRAGMYLNILGILLITGLTYAILVPVLGIQG
jgi:sodium-dependent dicarboxylate transporter 2/3/5